MMDDQGGRQGGGGGHGRFFLQIRMINSKDTRYPVVFRGQGSLGVSARLVLNKREVPMFSVRLFLNKGEVPGDPAKYH